MLSSLVSRCTGPFSATSSLLEPFTAAHIYTPQCACGLLFIVVFSHTYPMHRRKYRQGLLQQTETPLKPVHKMVTLQSSDVLKLCVVFPRWVSLFAAGSTEDVSWVSSESDKRHMDMSKLDDFSVNLSLFGKALAWINLVFTILMERHLSSKCACQLELFKKFHVFSILMKTLH